MAFVDVLQLITTHYSGHRTSYATLLDPCARDGSSILYLRSKIFGSSYRNIFAVEKNEALSISAKDCLEYSDKVTCGDFFHMEWSSSIPEPMCTFVWCKPPASQEFKFLDRINLMLHSDGVLIFYINHKALSSCVDALADNYRDIRVSRIDPNMYFRGVNDCVVMASKKNPVDPKAKDLLIQYASDFESIPLLKDARPHNVKEVPSNYVRPSYWEDKGFDIINTRKSYTIWNTEKGAVAGMDLPDHLSGALTRKFPLASKPRATHISAALSAGVFNGHRIEPNPEYPEYPSILIKGTFDKVYKPIEDKLDKEGVKVAELQVQQPALNVTVLDLSSGEFHNIATESSGDDLGSMSLRDLLDTYGQSLMRVMLDTCPVLHDPTNDPAPIPMPDLARPLFPAQEDAVRTIIKLRKENPQNGVLILGEIGSGKTSLTIASAKALGHKRTLVVCPPHLLSSWKEQISIVTPEAKVHILETLSDVDAFMAENSFSFGVLSRERAKLNHGWKSTLTHCPKCYNMVPNGVDLAKEHVKCPTKFMRPLNPIASWLKKHGKNLLSCCPDHIPTLNLFGDSPFFLQSVKKIPANPSWPVNLAEDMFRDLLPLLQKNWHALSLLTWAIPSLTKEAYLQNENFEVDKLEKYEMLRTLPVEEIKSLIDISSHYMKESFVREHNNFLSYGYIPYNSGMASGHNPTRYKASMGSRKAVYNLLTTLHSLAQFDFSNCGETLYEASTPIRYPFAKYISRRGKKGFDLLVIDEAHEVSNNMDSAQATAASILCNMRKPTFFLTGTSMNGYAESMFQMLRNLSPKFRSSFSREDVTDFIDQYGYWKQVVSYKDYRNNPIPFEQGGKISVRKNGASPGVLPVLTLEHVLPMAVTLQKEDLALSIPNRKDSQVDLFAGGKLYDNYMHLLGNLKEVIKNTHRTPGLAGKLWGALARLPFYMDMATIGNTDHGTFEIRWPKDCEMKGALVAEVPALDYDTILPKEQWMLATIAEEVAENRNVMVLCYHTNLMDRYVDLIAQKGFSVRAMESDKIPPAKRMDWITKNVVKPKIQVLVCNPVAIQTGLNNLVHFSTEIWMENPMCNPQTFRQACGRIDRIGQTKETKILFPVYKNTAQDAQHKLLMHKVGVSSSVDGLDPEEALRAAGVLDSEFNGFSVGKQLYKMLTEGV